MNKYFLLMLLSLCTFQNNHSAVAQEELTRACPECPPQSAVFCNICAGTGRFDNLIVQNDLTLCKGIVISATAPAPCIVTGCTGSLDGAFVVVGGVAIGGNLTVCGPVNSNEQFDLQCKRMVDGEINNNVQVGWDSGAVENGADNTFIGRFAGNGITDGFENTALGSSALTSITTGTGNIGVGFQALLNNTDGSFNTVVGHKAAVAPTEFDFIVAVGANAAQNNVVDQTVAVGFNALTSNTVGPENTAVGYNALQFNTLGMRNNAFGHSALRLNSVGDENVAVGTRALGTNSGGSQNVAVGTEALNLNQGDANTAVGHLAMSLNLTGESNTAVGLQAMSTFDVGLFNVAVGRQAMQGLFPKTTSGNANVAVGCLALFYNTGSENTACGAYALQANEGGDRNTACGSNALNSNILGNDNTAVGRVAMVAASPNSSSNTAVGAGSGLFLNGSYNAVVGANAGTFADYGNSILGAGSDANGFYDCIVLGYQAQSNDSRLLVLGAAAPHDLQTAASATAGAASALPALPATYLLVRLNNGTTLKIPLYNV